MTGPLGLYVPGRSPLHRCPPGPKLLGLAVALVLALRYPLLAAGPVVALYALARIPVRLALAQVRPLWGVLLVTGVFQTITIGWERAAEITSSLMLSVALASLVTLTTRVSAMLDTIAGVARPLRRIGIEPDRVALLLALTIRCVPLLTDILGSVREAQLARGAGRNPLALVVPVIIRTLRTADALGEALTARGVDDE
ncbi:MAG: energy-coupling factor transporter transmembrane protein EcfT [Dactylosporangium sp.]|nr:energy-coupling factor transporter transmembrane protein EcfT [Dactylosporangium sp.]NNJ60505.1 energy-coupling factor transporter transmembrane protein EcfT [Dactylosporangium sp.]